MNSDDDAGNAPAADFETGAAGRASRPSRLRGGAGRAPLARVAAFPARLSDDGPVHRAPCIGVSRSFSVASSAAEVLRRRFNLSLILQQVTIIAILGIAQTLVILTAGIDLSVGVIMVLSSVVMGRTRGRLRRAGGDRLPARPRSSGLPAAAVNGLIVTLLRLPPFIVTLGTWSIFGALNICYSRSETIRQQDIEAVAPFLQWTGTLIKPYDLILNDSASRSPG